MKIRLQVSEKMTEKGLVPVSFVIESSAPAWKGGSCIPFYLRELEGPCVGKWGSVGRYGYPIGEWSVPLPRNCHRRRDAMFKAAMTFNPESRSGFDMLFDEGSNHWLFPTRNYVDGMPWMFFDELEKYQTGLYEWDIPRASASVRVGISPRGSWFKMRFPKGDEQWVPLLAELAVSSEVGDDLVRVLASEYMVWDKKVRLVKPINSTLVFACNRIIHPKNASKDILQALVDDGLFRSGSDPLNVLSIVEAGAEGWVRDSLGDPSEYKKVWGVYEA